ncbi:MAG: hypothetical protein JWQ29_135 [Phenylobacterium sp.]|nr:hypothetical protein [Phenylobacterium sp.]
MSRVAIVGSCITRDLWRFRGRPATELHYVSRTSLPSLFAKPVAGFRPAAQPPAGLKPQPHRALVADIAKTALAGLVAFRPTHLIFDFIDERFDLLAAGESLITHSWELETSGYLKQPALRAARTIPRRSAAAERLWLDAAGEFAALVRATPLRDARLILHEARWARDRLGPEGVNTPLSGIEILPGAPADIDEQNALLARYEAAFTALMPAMAQVRAPEHRRADTGHEWGLSPFHYEPVYYAAIWGQLEDLGAVPA